MAQSRIESDLSNNPVPSKSRIERILNGEEVIPRSRIETLLKGYNPEDPGDYKKVECSKAEYDNMSFHDSSTIYVVTYPDESVHFYLGDTEIAGNPTLIEKTITSNGIYEAEDDSADGYSIVDVEVDNDLPVTFLKSIASQRNSIIMTDIIPAYDWTLEASVKLGNPHSSPNSMLFGCVSYDGQNYAGYYGVGYGNSGNYSMQFFDGNIWGSGNYSITVNSKYLNNVEPLIMRRGDAANIFGGLYMVNTAPASYTAISDGFAIFGGNLGGTPSQFECADVTLYGLKLYDNTGVLIHNLIPAQSKTTGRGGLYDIVTGKFYPSSTDFDDVVKEALS